MIPLSMTVPRHIHRNVTFRRLVYDAWQFIRSQRAVTRRLGRPFQVSRRFVEIDITYRCNLSCANCNRSCTQAPCDMEMSLEAIDAFLGESVTANVQWERVRLLGGEPTLHRRFFEVIERFSAYRKAHNPGMRLVVCTNGTGEKVRRTLYGLPPAVVVKNTFKGAGQPLFRPFNRAPVDSFWHRFSDFSSGCRILEECGLGLTPQGYYACAICGGIDRVFGFELGRPRLPAPGDTMLEQLSVFCPLCGHFGFSWPTRRRKVSPVWKKAYEKWYEKHPSSASLPAGRGRRMPMG